MSERNQPPREGGAIEPERADAGVVAAPSAIPNTRKHTLDRDAPPGSSLLIRGFPDDSTVARTLRTLDTRIGWGEQLVLCVLLALVIGTGAAQAVATRTLDHSFSWSFALIRSGTFAIAMIAAAFASQRGSHISMDLITRGLTPRRRLVARLVLAGVTILAAYLLLRAGLYRYDKALAEKGEHVIPPHWDVALILIGGGLVVLHTLLRALIDLDYLWRGKLPPEQLPAVH